MVVGPGFREFRWVGSVMERRTLLTDDCERFDGWAETLISWEAEHHVLSDNMPARERKYAW